MNKDIENKNNKGEYHGYQEWYIKDELSYRAIWKNNIIIGYEEWHGFKQANYYIK